MTNWQERFFIDDGKLYLRLEPSEWDWFLRVVAPHMPRLTGFIPVLDYA